jgi:DNA polymerase-3 subunit alpha
MAAVLSADMDHTDKVVTLIDECAHMGLEVHPPDVNRSDHEFTVAGDRELRYGLGAVKGVGQGAVESVMAERAAGGDYADLYDFCRRIDLQKCNRRTLEALIRAGALDGLGVNRATLMHQLPHAIRESEQAARAQAAGQDDLFGGPAAAPAGRPAVEDDALPDWSDAERLAGEKETLGLYLTGHPIEEYLPDLKYLTSGRISALAGDPPPDGEGGFRRPKREVIVAGLVVDMRRRGNRVSLVLDDRSGRMEATLFDDVYQEHRHMVAKDVVLIIEGGLRFDEFIGGWRVTAKTVKDVDTARQESARRLLIRWRANGAGDSFVGHLKDALEPFRSGECEVAVVYQGRSAGAHLSLGPDWAVRPTRELLHRLQGLVGGDNVRLEYRRRLD